MYRADISDFKIRQQLPPTVGSLQSLDQARTWLQACLHWVDPIDDTFNWIISKDHERCTHHSTPGYVPVRLLDLRAIRSGNWRVYIPSQDGIQVLAYATMSYRWGEKPFLKLTQQSLPAFRAGKPVSLLPRGFQDAILVTMHLGFQYIWIDALCIIQDSEEDFNNEACKMAEIYSNTAVNIIAAACESPSESLFKPRHLRGCHIGRFSSSWDASNPFFATLNFADSIMEIESFEREFKNSPTSLRGLILQERVLPARRLYFFRTQLHHACRSLEVCEVPPEEVPFRLKSNCHIYDLPPPSQDSNLWTPFTRWSVLAEE